MFLASQRRTQQTHENTTTTIRQWKGEKEGLYGLVVQLGLQLLRVRHLPHGLHEVLLGDVLAVGADGEQAWKRTETV